jgi:hypothetical protein
MVRRLGVLAAIAVVAFAIVVSSAHAALFFLFKPPSANADELVTVRLGGTPGGLTLAKREKPFQRPMRLYLVPNDVAAEVSSRADARLHFIGRLVPDRRSRGLLSFRVPPLDSGSYAVAAWCPGCARNSFGRTFFVLPVPAGGVGRFRHLQLLHVQLPTATQTCPVTVPRGKPPPGLGARAPFPGLGASPRWHANTFLWTGLPLDGVYVPDSRSVAPDGSVEAKLYWFAAVVHGEFSLTGQRLDGSSPALFVHRVNRESMTRFRGSGTWATPVTFPSQGCWRLTARVADVSLSFVVEVVAAP